MKNKTWDDITLQQFKEIQDILSVQDDYTTFNLLDTIYGIDSSEMTLNEVAKYVHALDFLKEDVPHVKLQDTYMLGGHTYVCNVNLGDVTAAQYVDYTSYAKKDNVKYEELLSVFFLPSGHTYNDGYDLKQVKQDLLTLPVTVVYTSAFFFETQLQIFVNYFQRYLTQTLKRMKVKDMKQKQLLLEALQQVDFSSLVSYRTYSNS